MTNALPETVAVGRPDQADITEADRFLASAQASYAVIKTGDAFEAAALDLQSIKTAQKALEEKRKKVTVPLNAVVKAVNELFGAPAAALEKAEKVIKTAMTSYQLLEEKKRRDAQAAAEEAARKERERLEAQAIKAADKGQVEKAAALQATAAAIPQTVEIASAAPKVSGIAMRGTWKATVKDKAAFVKFVAENPMWMNLLDVNEQALNGLARSQKSALQLPGVEAKEEFGIAARAA